MSFLGSVVLDHLFPARGRKPNSEYPSTAAAGAAVASLRPPFPRKGTETLHVNLLQATIAKLS